MKEVYVLSRKDFVEHCKRVGKEAFSYNDNVAVISIENMGEGWKHVLGNSPRVLNVEFDDVLFDDGGFKAVTPETAKEIWNFLFRINKEADEKSKDLTLIVHCGAGISRSGGVGLFASELFEIPYSEFKRLNPKVQHNGTVYSELLKACGLHYSSLETNQQE
ncbi:MAG: hypothetical protein M0P12_01210 [Paludibacteraceae bacterium]|nr:hypothetical protein [Paludibacteraceae bacterium]MCK9615534.1 hypothetical protein [Candidatus Omnitrophota bacterium]